MQITIHAPPAIVIVSSMDILNSIDPAWALIAAVPLMALIFALVFLRGRPGARRPLHWVALGVVVLAVMAIVASATRGA